MRKYSFPWVTASFLLAFISLLIFLIPWWSNVIKDKKYKEAQNVSISAIKRRQDLKNNIFYFRDKKDNCFAVYENKDHFGDYTSSITYVPCESKSGL